MKKYLIAIVVLGLLNIYQYYQIQKISKINLDKISDAIKEYSYVAYDTSPNYLNEPVGTEKLDIIDRINLLQDHANIFPSPKWIKDVTEAAKQKLK